MSKWPLEFSIRLDPRSSLTEQLIIDCLREVARPEISILDVGAGPLTSVGKEFSGKVLSITAIDPLADEYNSLLGAAGITPPVKTIRCRGEDLLERFARETFDLAFARFSLDHSEYALTVIMNMIEVVKEDGFVLLKHCRNEGIRDDLHFYQWNFDLRDDDVILWGHGCEYNLDRILGDRVKIESHLEPNPDPDHGAWITCKLSKRRS